MQPHLAAMTTGMNPPPAFDALRVFGKILIAVLAVLYPLAIYFGMQLVEPRTLGALLFGILLLRYWQTARQLAAEILRVEWLLFAGLAALALAIMVSNSETLLLFYPAAVSAGMLITFGRSLWYPPTFIERLARLSEPNLSAAGVSYTRQVTKVWCGFFIINGTLAAASVFASREWWLLYNGLIAYLLMGLLFVAEWLVRRRVRHQSESSSS